MWTIPELPLLTYYNRDSDPHAYIEINWQISAVNTLEEPCNTVNLEFYLSIFCSKYFRSKYSDKYILNNVCYSSNGDKCKNVLEVRSPVQGPHFIPIRLCVLLK